MAYISWWSSKTVQANSFIHCEMVLLAIIHHVIKHHLSSLSWLRKSYWASMWLHHRNQFGHTKLKDMTFGDSSRLCGRDIGIYTRYFVWITSHFSQEFTIHDKISNRKVSTTTIKLLIQYFSSDIICSSMYFRERFTCSSLRVGLLWKSFLVLDLITVSSS